MAELSCATLGFIVYYLYKLFMTPCFDSDNTTEPKPKMVSTVSTGKRIQRYGKMYVVLCIQTCAEKTTFLGEDD